MDDQSDTTLPSFVGFYSPWKAIGMTVIVGALAVCPLLPGFGEGLRRTAVFYTTFGYPFLVAACLVNFFLAVAMLPLVYRAVLRRPAIEISAQSVRIFGLRGRDYPLSCVAQGARKQFGNLFVRCPDGKQFTIPLWLYRGPHQVLAALAR